MFADEYLRLPLSPHNTVQSPKVSPKVIPADEPGPDRNSDTVPVFFLVERPKSVAANCIRQFDQAGVNHVLTGTCLVANVDGVHEETVRELNQFQRFLRRGPSDPHK